MANGDADARAMMDNARRQNFEFMQQARAQMQNQLEVQRMHIAHASGPAGVASGGSQPQPGTPAGRLLETITSLIQRGASMAAAPMVAGVGGFMAGAGTAGQVAGGAAGFYMSGGNTPFGIGGISGGMESIHAQRNMGFFQNVFTAYGRLSPLGGQFAAQRVDMTARQAETMAREELGSRLRQGAWSGVTAGLNAVTLGAFGYASRVSGVDITVLKREQMARDLQQQMRFVTRGALAAGGMGGAAGEFATGISRAGALEFGQEMNESLAGMQQSMGLSAREVMTLRGRAMGTMTRGGIERAVGGGPGALAAEVQKQTEAVRNVQQMLNVTEDIAPQFWEMVRKMGTVATEIERSAKRAVGMASRTGLGQLEVMSAFAEARSTGIQMGMGGARGERVTSQYMESAYQGYKSGAISREGMMFYGGNTPEEGLQIQARMQIQRNVGIWQGGGLGGLDVLTTGGRQNQAAWSSLMAGGMNYTQMAGAVGGALARNPLARLEARYAPETQEAMSSQALRAAFMRAEATPVLPLGAAGEQLQRMEAFRRMTGLTPEQARLESTRLTAERGIFEAPGRDKTTTAEMWSVYSTLQGQGIAEEAMQITGASSTYDAAVRLHKSVTRNGGKYDPSVDILDTLSSFRMDTGAAKALESIGGRTSTNYRAMEMAQREVTQGWSGKSMGFTPEFARVRRKGYERAEAEADREAGAFGSFELGSGRGTVTVEDGRLVGAGKATEAEMEAIRVRLSKAVTFAGKEASQNLGIRESLSFSRNRRVAETLFSGEGTEDFGSFAKQLANVDTGLFLSGDVAKARLEKYGMTELSAWSRMYQYGEKGLTLQGGGEGLKGVLASMFGAEGTSIVSGILSRATAGDEKPMTAGDIGKILEAGSGPDFDKVVGLLNRSGVSSEILQQVLHRSDSTKRAPLPGSDPGSPMFVTPSVEGQKKSWSSIFGDFATSIGTYLKPNG